MKRPLLLSAASTLVAATVQAEPIRIGVLFDLTGPVESLSHDMATSARSPRRGRGIGLFLGGREIEALRADSTCSDAGAATAAAERLVTADGVSAILGAACSGASSAVAAGVTLPHGVVQISPASTSPGLSAIEGPHRAVRRRQGEVLAEIVHGAASARSPAPRGCRAAC